SSTPKASRSATSTCPSAAPTSASAAAATTASSWPAAIRSIRCTWRPKGQSDRRAGADDGRSHFEETTMIAQRRNTLKLLGAMSAAAVLPCPQLVAAADAGTGNWPEKAIAYVVPFTPGGSTDVVG